ncbi:ABC transporter ATP-binding protein [Chloroflexota bacterium]
MALLRAENLGREYDGRYVLQDISLEIERGEAFALIGPTGAGKSTLLRLLDLLEQPTTGLVYFDGADVTRSGRARLQARRRMSLVQQKPIVFSMSVRNNVACGLRWRGIKKDVIRRKVDEALERVGLVGYGKRDARTLSGGETQRVAIARALVTEPEVLFLDEPTANLDPPSVYRIEEILERVIGEQKTVVIMATHDMSQGQRLAGRIGVLGGGEMLQVGTTSEVFCSPRSQEIAKFVGIENILAGEIVAKDDVLATIEVGDMTIQAISDLSLGDRVHALLRPEDVTITLAREKSSARNAFLSEISRMTPMGTLARIEVDCGFPILALLTTRSVQELELAVGSEVYASFKATAIHIIKRAT